MWWGGGGGGGGQAIRVLYIPGEPAQAVSVLFLTALGMEFRLSLVPRLSVPKNKKS